MPPHPDPSGMGGAMVGHMGMGDQAVDAHSLLLGWQLSPFPIAVAVSLVAIALWYLRAISMRSAGAEARSVPLRPWPRRRTAAFVAGLAAVEVALGSSVATLTASHFPAHILQHLGLMLVAPPLLALGAPMTLALQTSPRRTKRRLLAALHSLPFAVISHPVPVFFLYYASMFAFFLTPALGYAMDHMWLMDLINLGFLGGATLFWWPMVGLDPIPRWHLSPGFKFLYLLVGVPFESFLAIALLMDASPAAPMYSLSSTHTGAGVLWAASELLTAVSLLPVFTQWSRADARLARRIDATLDAGGTLGTPAADSHGLSATLKALRRG